MWGGASSVNKILVLNVATSVFVDSALHTSEKTRAARINEQVEHEDEVVQQLNQLFSAADVDNSGMLTWEEFSQYVEDDSVAAYLASLELDFAEASTLFRLLGGGDASSEVSIDDFAWGCLRLKGNAKSIDLCTLLYEWRHQRVTTTREFRELHNSLMQLQLQVSTLPLASQGIPPPDQASGRLEPDNPDSLMASRPFASKSTRSKAKAHEPLSPQLSQPLIGVKSPQSNVLA